MMETGIKCPRCGSKDTVKAGVFRTKQWGLRKRRKCKTCASLYYADWETMRCLRCNTVEQPIKGGLCGTCADDLRDNENAREAEMITEES